MTRITVECSMTPPNGAGFIIYKDGGKESCDVVNITDAQGNTVVRMDSTNGIVNIRTSYAVYPASKQPKAAHPEARKRKRCCG